MPGQVLKIVTNNFRRDSRLSESWWWLLGGASGIWWNLATCYFWGLGEHRVQVVKDRIWTENNVWETRSVGHQGSCEIGGWDDTKGEEASWKALNTCDKFNDMIIFYEKDEAPPIVSDQPLTINFPTKRQSQTNTSAYTYSFINSIIQEILIEWAPPLWIMLSALRWLTA